MSTNTSLKFPNVPVTSGGASSSSILSFRNRIINGDMVIAQRGTSFTVSNTSTVSSSNYTLDRWYAIASGGTPSLARVAGSAPFQYSTQITGASGVTALTFGQRIESVNIQDLANTNVTLSAYIKSSALTSITWTAYYANSVDGFSSKTSIASGTFTITSTMTRYTANISLPSGAANGVAIEFSVGSFTSGTLTVTGVQLETGSSATTFEQVPMGIALSNCQRYYEVLGANSTGNLALMGYASGNSDWYGVPWKFSVTKRATPTVTKYGTWAVVANCGQPTVTSPDVDGVRIIVTASGAGYYFVHNGAAGCYITVDVEL